MSVEKNKTPNDEGQVTGTITTPITNPPVPDKPTDTKPTEPLPVIASEPDGKPTVKPTVKPAPPRPASPVNDVPGYTHHELPEWLRHDVPQTMNVMPPVPSRKPREDYSVWLGLIALCLSIAVAVFAILSTDSVAADVVLLLFSITAFVIAIIGIIRGAKVKSVAALILSIIAIIPSSVLMLAEVAEIDSDSTRSYPQTTQFYQLDESDFMKPSFDKTVNNCAQGTNCITGAVLVD